MKGFWGPQWPPRGVAGIVLEVSGRKVRAPEVKMEASEARKMFQKNALSKLANISFGVHKRREEKKSYNKELLDSAIQN